MPELKVKLKTNQGSGYTHYQQQPESSRLQELHLISKHVVVVVVVTSAAAAAAVVLIKCI